jgi:flagellar hook-associated protein 1 FlgK
MPGLLTGLETAKRALLAQQLRLGVLSHNIANATTPGFSRQRVLLETTHPQNLVRGTLGTGVMVAQIRRHRDPFFDAQSRNEMGLLGQYAARSTSLLQVDSAIGEPGDAGLSAHLSSFWKSWHDLANHPRESSARAAVQGTGRALADAFRFVHSRLSQVETAINQKLALQAGDVNRLADELADLNRSIFSAESTGHEANDLRDRRDLLAEELSRLTGATAVVDSTGRMNVRLGGRFLVDRDVTNALAIDQGIPAGSPQLMWADSTRRVAGLGGELGGLLTSRDDLIAARSELDQLALAIINQVNTHHDDGSGTLNFFTGTGAADIELTTSIDNDSGLIRAGSGASGDNSIALAIAGLDSATMSALSDVSAGQYLASLVGRVGAQARMAVDLAETQSQVLQQVENQRQAISGVALDEEAAELMVAQRAFQAAAKVIDTLDSMLEVVIFTMAS